MPKNERRPGDRRRGSATALLLSACAGALSLFSASSGHAQAASADLVPNPLQLTAHHVTVSVADFEKECLWYQRVLGFTELRRVELGPDRKNCDLGIAGFRIDVAWQKGSTRPAGPPGPMKQGWMHIVFRSPAVEMIAKQMQKAGVDAVVQRDAQSAVAAIILHDPEGNEIGILPE